jgi:hypothetical protein
MTDINKSNEYFRETLLKTVPWVRLMTRIAEKLGFMKVREVTVCAKAGIER